MDSFAHGVSHHHSLHPVPRMTNNMNSCGQAYTIGRADGFHAAMTNNEEESHIDQTDTNGRILPHNDISHTYEASQDRRKRRKTSHEPELASDRALEEEERAASTTADEGADAGRPEQTSNVDIVHTPYSPPEEDEKHNESRQLEFSIAMPKKRGRPPKSVTGLPLSKPVVVSSASLRQETGVPSPHKPASTPHKATMQISADGKLFGSLRSSDNKAPAKAAPGGKSLALKNGKLAQNLIVVLRYNPSIDDGGSIGAKIEQVLSGQIRLERPRNPMASHAKPSLKSTHPFFLAKAAQQPTGATETTPSDASESKQEAKKPVAWKDLAFKTNKLTGSKNLICEKPLWPPLAYQHVGMLQRFGTFSKVEQSPLGKHKSKMRMGYIADRESVLSSYTPKDVGRKIAINEMLPPEKLRGTAAHVLSQNVFPNELQNNIRVVSATRSKMLRCTSAFDRAEPSGPHPWTQQYAPAMWEEVLQSTSHVLFEWLSGLVVHNVKQGLDCKQAKQPPKRRKRPKKRNDEFADFIDFEEEAQESTKIKNAILIVGPNGCGKTASVFAVAKQLGFEVFEIHSGMRRSQKDIFEKVGDMTQNHMVQRAQNTSRDSSVVHDIDPTSSPEEAAQPSLTSFLAAPHKKVLLNASRAATPQPNKQTQKQSLILIEEVDNVFEDDRGFWSGVQALIQNSKRPVVLTCNDVSSVPVNELDLFNTLIYTSPPSNIVAEYLCYIAAAEGHVIQPEAIRSLYESKDQDLRATITELQFWCQMAVGSTQGGLDWFPSHKPQIVSDNEPAVRTFSKDTFRAGLDLQPVSSLTLEEDLRFAKQSLDISYDTLFNLSLKGNHEAGPNSAVFQQALDLLEARSDAECIDSEFQPLLYSVIGAATPLVVQDIDRPRILEAKIESIAAQNDAFAISYDCLNALSVENSIHSLGQTRLAASLDSPRSVLACDVSPYVRSIVSYDLALERQRDETFSSQGKKSRNTRAARAAAEGGDKANTRRERWFTGGLDMHAVLRTGNCWPQWSDSQYSAHEPDEMEAIVAV